MTALLSSQGNIILDATSVTNLCACGHLHDICDVIGKQFFVASHVQREARYLYGQPARVLEDKPNELIDWGFITMGQLITTTDPHSEEELATWISLVAMGLEEGDALTCALAHHRRWILASDNEHTLIWLHSNLPELSVITTLDLVQEWNKLATPSIEILLDSLWGMKDRGSYEPHHAHYLHDWWVAMLSSDSKSHDE